MKAITSYLSGKKTYIIAVASIVYGVLAYEKVLPNPDHLALLIVQIGALAMGFRSALDKFIEILSAKA